MTLNRIFAGTVVLALAATNAFADCPVTHEETREILRAFPAAQAAERAGRPKDALALYVQAQGYTCDANPNAQQAARRAAALATPLATAAEQKSQWADAFSLYEQGGHYASADRMLMTLLRQNPDDVSLVTQHIAHFRQRAEESFASNHRNEIAAAGAYIQDARLRAELDAMPAKGVERAMAKEATAFNELYLVERLRLVQTRPEPSPATMDAMQSAMVAEQAFQQKWPGNLLKQSQEQLQRARQWATLAADNTLGTTTDAQTLARAESRAATLLAKYAGAPEMLEAAADYYRSVNHLKPAEARVAQITAQASALGDQARAKGQFSIAIAYYDVARLRDKADAARAQQQQLARQQMQPDIDAAMKAAEAMKARFSDPATIDAMKKQAEAARAAIAAAKARPASRAKETSDLENELGLR